MDHVYVDTFKWLQIQQLIIIINYKTTTVYWEQTDNQKTKTAAL